jgi:hypothetical protein
LDERGLRPNFGEAVKPICGSGKNSIIVWDYVDADWLGGQLREAGFEIQSLEQSSKISQHRSLRQSLEMIADWRPVMADLAEADIDALVADIETEFGAYLDEEGFHLPGEA